MDLENELLREFLHISSTTSDVFQQSVDAIYQTLDCKLCSFWQINKHAEAVSLIAFAGYQPDERVERAYVHPIKESFVEDAINEIGQDGLLVIDDITSHRLFPSLKLSTERMGIKKCIILSIPAHFGDRRFEALLFIYPGPKVNVTTVLLQAIRDFFSTAFSNYYLARKDWLTSSIIALHATKGYKDIGSIIHPIINDILREFIQYEGASAFVWDPFLNRLRLSATTGLEGNLRKKDVYYALGEGWTGIFAERKESVIINRPVDNEPGHASKYRERRQHDGRSYLFMPICSVVNNSLLGILRLVNKKNRLSNFLDHFSDDDLKLLHHVSYLISLYMEFDQSEKLMSAFSKHMSHEMLTPAIGIKGIASRLVRNKHKPAFLDTYLSDYSQSLFEYSSLQIAQIKNVEYIWSGDRDQAKNLIYNVEKVDLLRLIEYCTKLVFPLIREEGLRYDNIEIHGEFPEVFIDKHAWESVFLNLLTNSIKYRKRGEHDQFRVRIIGYELGPVEFPDGQADIGYLIQVIDDGSGIQDEDHDKIFSLGYRQTNIERSVVRGLGMGLTVVKHVLDDFFCSVWLSHKESPTEFSIFLPAFLAGSAYMTEEKWTSPPKQN